MGTVFLGLTEEEGGLVRSQGGRDPGSSKRNLCLCNEVPRSKGVVSSERELLHI